MKSNKRLNQDVFFNAIMPALEKNTCQPCRYAAKVNIMPFPVDEKYIVQTEDKLQGRAKPANDLTGVTPNLQ